MIRFITSEFEKVAAGKSLALAVIVALALGIFPAGSTAMNDEPEPDTHARPSTAAGSRGEAAMPTGTTAGQTVSIEGVEVQFEIQPLKGEEAWIEGQSARVTFRISDSATNNPMSGLRPAAWISSRRGQDPSESGECREKIRSFLQGSLRARPSADLNSYFILAMNQEASISVIDPLLGYGTSKLLTLILLTNPGEDWVLSSDGKRLFVSIPMSNTVAVVDTESWKATRYIDAGLRPSRLALQSDEKYLWVTNEDGVTAIDLDELVAVRQFQTGQGPIHLALAADDKVLFVAGEGDGTVSVIETRSLSVLEKTKVGKTVSSVSFSSAGGSVYATDPVESVIVALDSRSFAERARIRTPAAVRTVEFAPGGRWGFGLNPDSESVIIFDSSTNRIVQVAEVGTGHDQVAFTDDYAYLRSPTAEQVSMIPLAALGEGNSISIGRFPGGQRPPESPANAASLIAPTPEGNAVLVANTADQVIYYYKEGMTAPMGNFQNYRRTPLGVMIVDRSLRENEPGVYSTTVRLDQMGFYDVAFLLDSPRVVNCFDAAVAADPEARRRNRGASVAVEYLLKDRKVRPGEEFAIRFKLTDPASGEAREDLKDVNVLTFLSPGIWSTRQWARHVGSGVYYVFVESASLKVRYNELPHIILDGRIARSSGN